MSEVGPSVRKHKIVHASSSLDIINNFQQLYDTFQANLAELKINKTFQELDTAKNKWTHDKEAGGPHSKTNNSF